MSNPENIYTTFDRLLPREDKEKRLRQRGTVIWMYGLSGSGKSTLAIALERKLHEEGYFTQVLDGDNIRSGLNNNLGFSAEDRAENIRRIAEVAKLYANSGVVTICSFITPYEDLRENSKSIVGEDYYGVYVKASFETCAERDPKGLYAKVLRGEVKDFTGKDSLFEEPANPDLIIDTEADAFETCLEKLYKAVSPLVSTRLNMKEALEKGLHLPSALGPLDPRLSAIKPKSEDS